MRNLVWDVISEFDSPCAILGAPVSSRGHPTLLLAKAMQGCPPRLACFAVPRCCLNFEVQLITLASSHVPMLYKANVPIIPGMSPDSRSLPCALAFFLVIEVALHCSILLTCTLGL